MLTRQKATAHALAMFTSNKRGKMQSDNNGNDNRKKKVTNTRRFKIDPKNKDSIEQNKITAGQTKTQKQKNNQDSTTDEDVT